MSVVKKNLFYLLVLAVCDIVEDVLFYQVLIDSFEVRKVFLYNKIIVQAMCDSGIFSYLDFSVYYLLDFYQNS